MLYLNSVLFACLLIGGVSSQNTNSKDAIGFPESEEDSNLKNKDNRQPVYIPSMCPINELYYPGDQKDDWICDCRPSFIYHPVSDKCWPAFYKGPCQDGQYLILPPNSFIPICEKNPCVADGYVTWNGSCQQLGSVKPCEHLFPNAVALGVNATTLTVSCVRLNLENRFAEPSVLSLLCPPGCKRSIEGKCVPISL